MAAIKRMWHKRELRPAYDVIIIGGGVHGMATAYYLAKRGVTNVAVLEMNYIGSGGSGRNTAIIRSNYRTPEGVAFYDASVKLYEDLSSELKYNMLFSQQGHITLAHNERSVAGLRERAEVNRLMGVDSRLITPQEVKRMVPALDISQDVRYPIMAALYHPPGGIIRHDAVVWGYARAADQQGVSIFPYTRVTAITRDAQGRVTGVETDRGPIKSSKVVSCTAGWTSTITAMVGVEVPITTHTLQALVTEPLKPFLDKVIVSATLHCYISQTDRGEFVIGAEIDPYTTYSLRSTLPFMEASAHHMLELFPALHQVRVLRQWAGICDMTPDYSPIMGIVDEVPGFYIDAGWGTYGFKAGPISGKLMAELVATDEVPVLLRPFALSRFADDHLVGEKAAASVSH